MQWSRNAANRCRTSVLRERYLRDDIPCGYEGCKECADYPGYRAALPAVGFTKHRKWTGAAGHWLVVDTNIVLGQVCDLREKAYDC